MFRIMNATPKTSRLRQWRPQSREVVGGNPIVGWGQGGIFHQWAVVARRSNRNVVPFPGSLSTVIFPP